jgi:hypothetical protein
MHDIYGNTGWYVFKDFFERRIKQIGFYCILFGFGCDWTHILYADKIHQV